MPSDIRTGLKTTEEYIEGASISYIPSILALPKLKKIDLDIDRITYKELNVEGDSVVPSFLTAEMTEINSAKVSSSSRVFNAYGKGIKLVKDQYKNSGVNVQTFHDQILRELSKKFDNIALAGEGGNNGLITSSDVNFVAPTSVEIPAISGNGFNRVLAMKRLATALNTLVNDYTGSSDLTVFFFGSTISAFLGDVAEGEGGKDVRSYIHDAFAGKSVTFVEISALSLTGISANGMVVVSNDLTTVEHCGTPTINNDGVNAEDDYYWARYFFGAVNVRPEVYGAVIKQVITFA